MKKFLIGSATFILLSTAAAFAQDGGGGGGGGGGDGGNGGLRGLDLSSDPYPGMGAMRTNQGEVVFPDGEISGIGALNDPGNGGTYPGAGPQAYVPGWKIK